MVNNRLLKQHFNMDIGKSIWCYEIGKFDDLNTSEPNEEEISITPLELLDDLYKSIKDYPEYDRAYITLKETDMDSDEPIITDNMTDYSSNDITISSDIYEVIGRHMYLFVKPGRFKNYLMVIKLETNMPEYIEDYFGVFLIKPKDEKVEDDRVPYIRRKYNSQCGCGC